MDGDLKEALQKDVLVCVLFAANQEEKNNENDKVGQRVGVNGTGEQGWTTIVLRWRRRAKKCMSG